MRARGTSWFIRSLPARLAIFAMIFIAAVAGAHGLALDRLLRAREVSGEVRNRWLDSISVLYNVGRRLSDLRGLEADLVLIPDPARRERAFSDLPGAIDELARAVSGYRPLAGDREEMLAFDAVSQAWAEHADNARTLALLSQNGQGDAASALFDGPARSSYERVRNSNRQLVDLATKKAESARDRAARAFTDAERWISDLIAGTGVLFAALAIHLWWSVSRPLFELAGLMRRLASHDTDFSVRFDGRRDEIGEVARALAVFRRNIIELLDSRRRLSNQAEILAGSLDKERALATEQRNFISTISHEFRTPLTAIDGHAQRLIATRERAKPAEIGSRAEKIRAGVFRMTSLVASLVNAMELAHGDLRARMRPFDLKQMLESLARYYNEIGVGGGLEARIAELPPQVTGDRELLYQVFSNLVSNAFKYSPAQSSVTLSASARDGIVEILVEDRGLGIPRDEIGRIRERYYRASNVGSIPGTGMGLHLVDEIVRQHGGRLEVESEEGKGTRMTVFLPVAGAGPRAEGDGAADLMPGGQPGTLVADSERSGGVRLHG